MLGYKYCFLIVFYGITSVSDLKCIAHYVQRFGVRFISNLFKCSNYNIVKVVLK